MGQLIAQLLSLVFPLAMLAIIAMDLGRYQIPNWLVVALALTFPPYAYLAGLGWMPIGYHLGIGLLLLVIGLGLFLAKWLGGGDGKALAAAALWLGPSLTPSFLVMTAVFGGVVALALILFRRVKLSEALAAKSWVARLHDQKGSVPYGVAIGLAGLLLYPRLPGVPF